MGDTSDEGGGTASAASEHEHEQHHEQHHEHEEQHHEHEEQHHEHEEQHEELEGYQHETEVCERALRFDNTEVDGATRLGATLFWGAVTSGSLVQMVKRGEHPDGSGLLNLLGLLDAPTASDSVGQALGFLVTGTAALRRNEVPLASVRFVRVALKSAAWVALAGLSYCPVGRLAFARPLRRLAINLARSSGGSGSALSRFARAFASMAVSKQGLLALANALILPLLQKLLHSPPARQTALRRVLGTLIAGLRVILTVTSATAAYTQLRPSHLIPSNPWESEPGTMEYLRRSALQQQQHHHHQQQHRHHGSGSLHTTTANGGPVDVPAVHVEGDGGPIGVLVCNLGTTPTPKPGDVAEFLREFLMDPRVVEILPPVWGTVLKGFIIPIRKYTSGQLYQRLFENAGTGVESPLVYHTRRFSHAIQEHLGSQFVVEFGMRYGEPSLSAAMASLKQRGCERVIVFPDYPQYSGTTSASIYDEVFAQARKYRFVPTLRIVPPFYAHPAYIHALVATASEFLADHTGIEKYVISFHGIPERYHLRGDPYPWHCEATAKAIAQGMGWRKDQWLLSYQSVFGKDPWLLPATDETVEKLGQQGVKKIAVLCPGFLTDCLETIDENGTENANVFKENGGEELILVPCLNSSPVWCEDAATIIRNEAQGWIPSASSSISA